MVRLTDETTPQKPIHTLKDIMRERRLRGAKQARRRAAATFAKEFITFALIFGVLFFIIGGMGR